MKLSKRLALVVPLVAGLAAVGVAGAAHSKPNGPHCGDTISQDTTLTESLYCSGDGLIVAPSVNVTIDFAHHRLFGSGSGTGITTAYTGSTVTIKDGTIRGFGDGLGANDRTSAQRMRIIGNSGFGVWVGISDAGPTQGFVLKDSVVIGNGGGISLGGSLGTQIVDSRIVANGGYGIVLGGHSDRTTISGSYIARNGSDGVYSDQSFIRFTNNRFIENAGNGVFVLDSLGDGYFFADNLALRNGQLGIAAPEGAVDGGGNKAAGNGDPLQCINIVCTAMSVRAPTVLGRYG
jgi:hypothetical protein